jgi:hypothetical protein
MLILGFIFINGLLNAINPKLMWRTFEGWKAMNEPSTTYFIVRRIGGIVAMIFVLAAILIPFIMSRI